MMTSNLSPLLTDAYQLSMCYAYWKNRRHNDHAVFDLYFRKNPFGGEFTLFCGLQDCLDFVEQFAFTESDMDYIRTALLPAQVEPEFIDYLRSINSSNHVTVHAIAEGTVVFPRVPLLTIEAPLAIAQLLESTLLNLVNYASLVATNAARMRIAAGKDAQLLEFGLRRAQGPNGAISASKYCYVGGFDATSNVLAGRMFNIPVRGTHAHSFVTAFSSLNELPSKALTIRSDGGDVVVVEEDFASICSQFQSEICQLLADIIVSHSPVTNLGEFASFVAYALTFPSNFLALIDTYDVIRSGVVNFCAVALALNKCGGYRAVGVRIDSGDLAYLSRQVRQIFSVIADRYQLSWFTQLQIVVSNDINEETIYSLKEQAHSIDSFGIGTHLVTCQKQPALGCVYKLVELEKVPRIKLSEDFGKITIPAQKRTYRLFGKDGRAILDLMCLHDEQPPTSGKSVLCRHPFVATKRALVTPDWVQLLQQVYFENGKRTTAAATAVDKNAPLAQAKRHALASLDTVREDHKRNLNPTPFKVSVSERLFDYIQQLWMSNAPIVQLE